MDYKLPKQLKKGMPTKSPLKSDFKAPDLTSRIPGVRPMSKKNLGPLKGFNNGK